jgi:hypothetical protein
MNRGLTFVLGIVLGLVIGGGLILYMISPRGNTMPRGSVIQPPDPQGTPSQTAAIQLNESFFTPIIGTIFSEGNEPAFPLSLTSQAVEQPVSEIACGKIILKAEGNGVKTAVRMSDGKIMIPLAFSGNISAFGGCYDFNGWSESQLEMRFDEQAQMILGYINVQTVNLEGVSPVVGGVLTPLVQSSINQRFNPVQILRADQIAVKVPLKSAGTNLQGLVKDVRAEVRDNALTLFIYYEFNTAPATAPENTGS